MIAFASPVPAYSVLPEASFGSTTSEPSAFVGRPVVTAFQAGVWSRPFVVRQMPPPAAATQMRHPLAAQFGSMASAVMRPEVIESRRLTVTGLGAMPTSGPRNSHGTITCGDFEPVGPDLTEGPAADRGGQFIASMARAPSDRKTMWVSTRLGRLFVASNADADDPAAVTFARIDTRKTPGRFVSGIAVDPRDPNHAFVSYSGYNAATPDTPGHVFDVRFDPRDGRARFRDISRDLADQPITDVAYDDRTGDLYAATDYGVLRLPDDARHWANAADGLPLASVPGLTIMPEARVLYAATYGRSAFRLRLPAAHRHGD